ncbi:MAG: ATP-binding cassette domain-containing protein [Actinomycetota bacterium]|nr:ATP-binding cassette domain-containing protein [Actinomycetota bacterium]
MIAFERVSVIYDSAPAPVLRHVTLHVEEGELALVVGRTGVGKSTLLGAVNGLVPHFTGGTLAGRVIVDGHDTRNYKPRELAGVVGVVGQDPHAGFVTDVVEDELAYGMEQLAVAPDVMRTRVEEVLDLLGIAGLRDRPLVSLSGGEAQRVAIGSVFTVHPKVLVLDEPTSALDPTAAEEVLAAVTRLVHDVGITALVAEHRLERVVQYADRVIEVRPDGSVVHGRPAEVMASSEVAPPVVELGKLAGWSPLPLSVRDARRQAIDLRDELADRDSHPSGAVATPTSATPTSATPKRVLSARHIVVRYGAAIAVAGVDLDLHAGEVTALMGRNGSGKSSLLWALQGTGTRQSGTVDVDGSDPGSLAPAQARRLVGLVPQTPADLLYLDTVRDECAQADRESGAAGGPNGRAREILELIAPGLDDGLHPRDLSEGQRLALVLAVQLAAAPRVILLDEPTRGLDYAGKQALSVVLGKLAAGDRAVVVSTHDVEFAAEAAERVVVMAAGDVVADGPARGVLCASPALAPQVAKIMSPLDYLTVDEVARTRTGGER